MTTDKENIRIEKYDVAYKSNEKYYERMQLTSVNNKIIKLFLKTDKIEIKINISKDTEKKNDFIVQIKERTSNEILFREYFSSMKEAMEKNEVKKYLKKNNDIKKFLKCTEN